MMRWMGYILTIRLQYLPVGKTGVTKQVMDRRVDNPGTRYQSLPVSKTGVMRLVKDLQEPFLLIYVGCHVFAFSSVVQVATRNLKIIYVRLTCCVTYYMLCYHTT